MRALVSAAYVCLVLVFGLSLVPQPAVAGPAAATVTASLVYVEGPIENRTFRFDYTITNNSIEPSISGFIVFFDADGLNRANFLSYTAPTYWDDVFVTPEAPDGSWNVEWDELSGTDRIEPGESHNGFSVTFQWNDPYNYPGSQEFEVWNGGAYEGETIWVPGGPTNAQLATWGRIKELFR
ncbi:MAG: hypothetical protein JW952_08835 [Candidatus Eisenbacteria bacterium]|nr:hypothetical protein [Candidatus Eisenbacteria bacterium]